MTLIMGWIAHDSRKPCSAYIASDSRISNGQAYFDYEQKVFAFRNTPDIMAYCGEVLFTSHAISRMVGICDDGGLVNVRMNCDERSNIFYHHLSESHKKYELNRTPIKIYHIGRNTNLEFQVYVYEANAKGEWSFKEIPYEKDISSKVFCDGSGADSYEKRFLQFEKGNNENTSRNYFHCFCDTLYDIPDKYCGGAPQLVGLYNGKKFNGMYHGIISHNECFYRGERIDSHLGMDSIRWYNENFEICDFDTKQIKINAMRQPISKKATP